MRRLIVRCPCGETVIWTKDVDDGSTDFDLREGTGDTQPCCEKHVAKKEKNTVNGGDLSWDVFKKGVKPLKKK